MDLLKHQGEKKKRVYILTILSHTKRHYQTTDDMLDLRQDTSNAFYLSKVKNRQSCDYLLSSMCPVTYPMEAAVKSEILINFAQLWVITLEGKVIYSIKICIMSIKFSVKHKVGSYCFFIKCIEFDHSHKEIDDLFFPSTMLRMCIVSNRKILM